MILPLRVICLLQRISVDLRIARLLVLLCAEIGVNGGKPEQQRIQPVRLDVVIVVLRRTNGKQLCPEHTALPFGKRCFLTEQDAAPGIAHDLLCAFSQIQISGRVQKCSQFFCLLFIRQNTCMMDAGRDVMQQHLAEKLRERVFFRRKLRQRLLQIEPCF